MVYSVSIIGGLCSRYIFEHDVRNYFKIDAYLEKVIPLIKPKHDTELDHRIDADLNISNWKHLLVREDISGISLKRALEKRSDYIILDFATVIDGFYYDNENGNIYAPFDFYRNYVNENFAFQKVTNEFIDENIDKFVQFINKIREAYNNEQIILIKTKIPDYIKCEYGPLLINNDTDLDYNNKLLLKIYSIFENQFENDAVKPYIIDLCNFCISDSNHEYGLKQYNFVPKFYEKAINLLYSIVDGTGNEVHEPDLNKPKYALLINRYDKNNALESLGRNSGNLAFWSSIKRLFEPDLIPYDCLSKNIDLTIYDALIITDLIWIRENQDYSYLNKIVEAVPEKIVFMSVGLQSSSFKEDFQLHQSVIELLSKVPSNRKIGVRGRYTESILNKYGIMNTQVIGCPSMYYWNNRELQVPNDREYPTVAVANFRSFYGSISKNEKCLLKIFREHKFSFIEQNDIDYEKCASLSNLPEIAQYLVNYSNLYTTDTKWMQGIWNNNFSVGMRFHANVMALRAGIRSLFVVSDSRTREMTDYYKLPSIDISQINEETTLDMLLDLADYTEFNKTYPTIFDNFIKFLTANNMKIVCKDVLPFNQQCNNELILSDTKLESLDDGTSKVTYCYKIKGKWQINFISNHYSIVYSKSLLNIPKSILNIPFLGNILPLSWICNAKVVVQDIDYKFLSYLKYVKNSYRDMNVNEYFGGNIVYSNIEINSNLDDEDKSILLYSGGVGATNSLIDLLDVKPTLFTIWGSDIFFSKNDTNAWNVIALENSKTAADFNLEHVTCKSEFRLAIDTINRKSWINNAINTSDNYWHVYQHGMALITHVAPLAYMYNYKYVHIASSYSSKNKIECCASLPQIDENVRFSTSRVYHNTFGDSRSDKIMKIIDYSEEHKYPFKLRVCWETVTGNNCCLCEKCVRTIFTILLLNRDPKKYGFNVSDEIYDKIIEKFQTNRIHISQFYIDAAVKYSKTYDSSNKLANYLIDLIGLNKNV